MTDVEHDPIRVFSNALTPAARHHLELHQHTIPVIRQAAEKTSPTELARIVGKGIGWHTPANPWPLMWFRLRRSAGLDDTQNDDQEMTD